MGEANRWYQWIWKVILKTKMCMIGTEASNNESTIMNETSMICDNNKGFNHQRKIFPTFPLAQSPTTYRADFILELCDGREILPN